MSELEPIDQIPEIDDSFKTAYGMMAVRLHLDYGETGEDIVRMVTQYIAEGFMDWGQGMIMLKAVFEPEGEDG